MKPVLWMVGLCVASAGLAGRLAGHAWTREIVLGMIGPLAAATATWIAVARTSRVAPDRVSSVLLRGFALKMLLFGVYVVAVVKAGGVRPVPFVVSFTSYFIALYAAEAALFSRLFSRPVR